MIRIEHFGYQPSKVFGLNTTGELLHAQTRYALGYDKPHFPPPCTMRNADTATCWRKAVWFLVEIDNDPT